MTDEEKQQRIESGKSAVSKLSAAAAANTDIHLTAEELAGYVFLSSQAVMNAVQPPKPPKREKDFDELAREADGDDGDGEMIIIEQPLLQEGFNQMPFPMRRMKPKLKYVAHSTLQGVEDLINEKFAAQKDFNMLWSVQRFSEVGFVQAIIEYEPEEEEPAPTLAVN